MNIRLFQTETNPHLTNPNGFYDDATSPPDEHHALLATTATPPSISLDSKDAKQPSSAVRQQIRDDLESLNPNYKTFFGEDNTLDQLDRDAINASLFFQPRSSECSWKKSIPYLLIMAGIYMMFASAELLDPTNSSLEKSSGIALIILGGLTFLGGLGYGFGHFLSEARTLQRLHVHLQSFPPPPIDEKTTVVNIAPVNQNTSN